MEGTPLGDLKLTNVEGISQVVALPRRSSAFDEPLLDGCLPSLQHGGKTSNARHAAGMSPPRRRPLYLSTYLKVYGHSTEQGDNAVLDPSKGNHRHHGPLKKKRPNWKDLH